MRQLLLPLIFIAFSLFISCKNEPEIDVDYSLVDENIRETESEYKISLAYVVKGNYTVEDLTKLADYLLNQAKKRRGYKSFEYPEKIGLDIYASESDIIKKYEKDGSFWGFFGEPLVEGYAHRTSDYKDWEPDEIRIMPSPIYKPEEFYINRASTKFFKNDYQGALEDCNKLFEIVSEAKRPYFMRGEVKYFLKDYNGAIDDFTMNLKYNADSVEDITIVDSLTYRGLSKGMLENWNGALKDCQDALRQSSITQYPSNTIFYELQSSGAKFCIGISKIKIGNTLEGCAELSTLDSSKLDKDILSEFQDVIIANCSNRENSQTISLDEKKEIHRGTSGTTDKDQSMDGAALIEQTETMTENRNSKINIPRVNREPNTTKSTSQKTDISSTSDDVGNNQQFEKEVKRYMEGLSHPDPAVPDFEKNTCKPRNMPKAMEEACKRLGYWK